jgi:hypothetical protein
MKYNYYKYLLWRLSMRIKIIDHLTNPLDSSLEHRELTVLVFCGHSCEFFKEL